MKKLLAAMFVALLMVGCGESAQKSLEEQRNELMERLSKRSVFSSDRFTTMSSYEVNGSIGTVNLVLDLEGFAGWYESQFNKKFDYEDFKKFQTETTGPALMGTPAVAEIWDIFETLVLVYANKKGEYLFTVTAGKELVEAMGLLRGEDSKKPGGDSPEHNRTAVDQSDLELGAGGLAYLSNADLPYSGWAKRIYDNGQIEMLMQFKDGKEDGPHTSWYENGKKKTEGTWKNGKEDGPVTHWHDNGKKEIEGFIKNGKQDGIWVMYNKDGTELGRTTYRDGNRVKD
jgi:antitoxin component YwqK of YwqJK toxin-antitoxin module